MYIHMYMYIIIHKIYNEKLKIAKMQNKKYKKE